ncbi:MAG: hypothetical protein O2829_03375 [Bacteroidetes bacterium]|nr:hypothetical protein [Bacteroidota bacterium]
MLDQTFILALLKEKGKVYFKEGSGKFFCLRKGALAEKEILENGIYLLFDLFQIRTLCVPFSEVSLDIVEFASKPTIYQSPANPLLPKGAVVNGLVRFSLIREPNWNKLLFQIAHPVLFTEEMGVESAVQTSLLFPLFHLGTKELFLGPEGEVKIRKG